MIKEEFYAYASDTVNIETPNLSPDDVEMWYNENFDAIEKKLLELGYNTDNAIDVVYGENKLSYIFKSDRSVLIYESDFRGYILSEGGSIRFAKSGIKNILIDEFGDECYNTVYDIFKVISDDELGVIKYYIKCLITGNVVTVDKIEE